MMDVTLRYRCFVTATPRGARRMGPLFKDCAPRVQKLTRRSTLLLLMTSCQESFRNIVRRGYGAERTPEPSICRMRACIAPRAFGSSALR